MHLVKKCEAILWYHVLGALHVLDSDAVKRNSTVTGTLSGLPLFVDLRKEGGNAIWTRARRNPPSSRTHGTHFSHGPIVECMWYLNKQKKVNCASLVNVRGKNWNPPFKDLAVPLVSNEYGTTTPQSSSPRSGPATDTDLLSFSSSFFFLKAGLYYTSGHDSL